MWRELKKDYLTPKYFRDISSDDLLSITHMHNGVGHDAHGATWLAMAQGKKMWFLGKPGTERPKDPQCDYDVDIKTDYKTLQCVQNQNEVIYFPEMWWHATCNMEDWTVGIGAQNQIEGWNEQTEPVLWAAQHGEIEKLEQLKQQGVRMRTGRQNVQPIHLAAYAGHEETVHWLAANGGELMSRDDKLQYPLHYAVDGGYTELVKWMVMQGVPLNAADMTGATAMHEAAKFGNLKMVQLLLDLGADINIKDGNGAQPMHYAVEGQGHVSVITYLAENGADMLAKNGYDGGQTPLQVIQSAYMKALDQEAAVKKYTEEQQKRGRPRPTRKPAMHISVSSLKDLAQDSGPPQF